MVCFRDERSFNFPEPQDLRFTMSDILKAKCTWNIGYTLRVGGRKSGVDGRRNWDGYVTDKGGEIFGGRRSKKNDGLLDSFVFPCSENESLKQLGNSVCVPVVSAILRVIKGS